MVRIDNCPLQLFLAEIIPLIRKGYESEVLEDNGFRFFKNDNIPEDCLEEYIYYNLQKQRPKKID